MPIFVRPHRLQPSIDEREDREERRQRRRLHGDLQRFIDMGLFSGRTPKEQAMHLAVGEYRSLQRAILPLPERPPSTLKERIRREVMPPEPLPITDLPPLSDQVKKGLDAIREALKEEGLTTEQFLESFAAGFGQITPGPSRAVREKASRVMDRFPELRERLMGETAAPPSAPPEGFRRTGLPQASVDEAAAWKAEQRYGQRAKELGISVEEARQLRPVPEEPLSILDVAKSAQRKEREFFRPYTRPVGGTLARGLTVAATAPVVEPLRRTGIAPDLPSAYELGRKAEDVGATIAEYGLLPSNLIPLPIIDPAVARVLRLGFLGGELITRSALRALRGEAHALATSTAEVALKDAAARFVVSADEVLGQAAARGAPLDVTVRRPLAEEGVVRPVEEAVPPVGEMAARTAPPPVGAVGEPLIPPDAQRIVQPLGRRQPRTGDLVARTESPNIVFGRSQGRFARDGEVLVKVEERGTGRIHDLPLHRVRAVEEVIQTAEGQPLRTGEQVALGPARRPGPLTPEETAETASLRETRETSGINEEQRKHLIDLETREAEEVAGIPRMAGGDPKTRLVELIEKAKPIRGQSERLKSQELARRSGAVKGVLERAKGREGLPQALAQMRGDLPKPAFEAPEIGLRADEIDVLFGNIWDFPDIPPFERVNTATALQKLLLGEIPTRGELGLLEDVFGPELIGAVLGKRPLSQKLWEEFVSAMNLPRALLASFDFSAPLRQGIMLVGHTPEFLGNVPVMIRAFAKEEVAEAVDLALRTGAKAQRRRAAGLAQTKFGLRGRLAEREEAFMTRLAHKIPGIRRSERAFVTYLNKLRADVFDNVVAGWDRLGTTTVQDEKALADMINAFSGRGDLGPLNQYAPVLNQVFWSARLNAGRIQAPFFLVSHSAAVRKVAARDLAAFMGLGISILSLAKLAGAEVELDPRSTDFGKIRIGPTRVDFWGGMQPLVRYTAQVITGKRKTSIGEIMDATRGETIQRLIRSKLSPQLGLVTDILKGETFIGGELTADARTVQEQAFNRLVPLFIQDVVEATRNHGFLGFILATPGAFGANVQSYRTFSQRVAAQIAEDLERGLFADRYNDVPRKLGDLAGPDREDFLVRHQEIAQQLEDFPARTERARAFEAVEEVRERFGQEQRDDDQLLANWFHSGGETGLAPDRWQDREREREGENFARRDEIYRQAEIEFDEREFPAGTMRRAIEDYFSVNIETFTDPATAEVDWSAFTDARDAALGGLSASEKGRVMDFIKRFETPIQRSFRKLREQLDEYYDIPPDDRRGRDAWRRGNPEGDAILFLTGSVTTLMGGRARSEAERLARRIFGSAAQIPRDVQRTRRGRTRSGRYAVPSSRYGVPALTEVPRR